MLERRIPAVPMRRRAEAESCANTPSSRRSDAFGSHYGTPTQLWWAAVDSNHLPPRYQHGALPVELAAHGLGKGSGPERNGRTGTLPWQESALEGGAGRVSGAFADPAPDPRELHRRRDFVHRDLAPGLEHRTCFRQLDRLAQRLSLEDRIARRRGADRAVVHGAVARDALRLRRGRVAGIHNRRPQLAEPCAPVGHHLVSLRLSRGHAAAVVNEQKIRHRRSPFGSSRAGLKPVPVDTTNRGG